MCLEYSFCNTSNSQDCFFLEKVAHQIIKEVTSKCRLKATSAPYLACFRPYCEWMITVLFHSQLSHVIKKEIINASPHNPVIDYDLW